MNKQFFSILFIFVSLISCSSDSNSEEIAGEIRADYISDISKIVDIDGFAVSNNSVYITGGGYALPELKKIDQQGKVSNIETFEDLRFFYNKLTNNSKGEIFLTTNNSEVGDKMYNITNNFFTPYYTLKYNNNIGAPTINAICNYKDDYYFIFDLTTFSLKKINTSLKTELLIAGSGKPAIKDGIGTEASFGKVYQILIKNDIIYVLDNDGNGSKIRKIENTTNGWKVTTLNPDTYDYINQIAIDNYNNLYYLINTEGIYKIDLTNDTEIMYHDDEIKIGTYKEHLSINFKHLRFIGINNDDLYLFNGPNFIKISNFKSKL